MGIPTAILMSSDPFPGQETVSAIDYMTVRPSDPDGDDH
jgi:hypothetical protein